MEEACITLAFERCVKLAPNFMKEQPGLRRQNDDGASCAIAQLIIDRGRGLA